MKTKHTPGPWVHEAVMGDLDLDICLAYAVPSQGCPIVIASTYCDDDDESCSDFLPKSTAIANARLISAAPDLLAACEALQSWATVGSDYPPGDGMESLEQCVRMARAAIAKATGEGAS